MPYKDLEVRRAFQREYKRRKPRTAEQKRYRDKNPHKRITKERKWELTYNAPRKRYNEMLSAQGNKCRICETPFSETIKPVTDHDHSCCPGDSSCGLCVRWLLCSGCNTGLGAFKDSPKALRKAAELLQRFVLPDFTETATRGPRSKGLPTFEELKHRVRYKKGSTARNNPSDVSLSLTDGDHPNESTDLLESRA